MSTGSTQGGADGPLFEWPFPAQRAQHKSPGLVLQVRQEEGALPQARPSPAQPSFGNSQHPCLWPGYGITWESGLPPRHHPLPLLALGSLLVPLREERRDPGSSHNLERLCLLIPIPSR